MRLVWRSSGHFLGWLLPMSGPVRALAVAVWLWVATADPGVLFTAWCNARCHDNADANCSVPCEKNVTSSTSCNQLCGEAPSSPCSKSCVFLLEIRARCKFCSVVNNCCRDQDAKDQDLPPIPTNVTLHERRFGRVVQVVWVSPGYLSDAETVIHVLQMRWGVGAILNLTSVTEWETLTQTTAGTVILKEVLFPGRWYQFRVAAVSSNGTQGFSEHSSPFILSVPPRPPGVPQNLQEEPSSGTGYPTIRWEPPTSDLPIDHYRVTWMQRLREVHMRKVGVREYQRLIPANRLSFTMKQVESDALYQVQVQAICHFGNRTLEGERATIYVKTFSIEHAESLSTKPPRPAKVTVSQVFIVEDNLHVNISWNLWAGSSTNTVKHIIRWKANECEVVRNTSWMAVQHTTISKNSFAVLHDLLPNCNYDVSIQNLHSDAEGDVTSTQVNIPSCHNLHRDNIFTSLCNHQDAYQSKEVTLTSCSQRLPHLDVMVFLLLKCTLIILCRLF